MRGVFATAPWLVVACFLGACSSSDGAPEAGVDAGGEDARGEDAPVGAAEDAGGTDARDARPPDTGRPDVGFADAGVCSCSYGFHTECAQGELCQRSHFPLTCNLAEPAGGAATGACSTIGAEVFGGPCNAQCGPESMGSPCGEFIDRIGVEASINAWFDAMDYASTHYPDLQTPQRMPTLMIDRAREVAPSPECGEFIAWSVLALVRLCRGEDAIIPPATNWPVLEAWQFKPIAMDDRCRRTAGGACREALAQSVDPPSEFGLGFLDQIPPACTSTLPYAPPCAGADAHACLRERVRTLVHALNSPAR